MLLTNGSTLPPAVAKYLLDHPGAQYIAIGGPAAQAAPTATPIVGVDRFDTAVQVAESLFSAPTVVGAASGETFPDGLSGGAMIGKAGGPLLLVTGSVGIPPIVEAYLQAHASTVNTVQVFGGPGAVSDAIVRDLTTAMLVSVRRGAASADDDDDVAGTDGVARGDLDLPHGARPARR